MIKQECFCIRKLTCYFCSLSRGLQTPVRSKIEGTVNICSYINLLSLGLSLKIDLIAFFCKIKLRLFKFKLLDGPQSTDENLIRLSIKLMLPNLDKKTLFKTAKFHKTKILEVKINASLSTCSDCL